MTPRRRGAPQQAPHDTTNIIKSPDPTAPGGCSVRIVSVRHGGTCVFTATMSSATTGVIGYAGAARTTMGRVIELDMHDGSIRARATCVPHELTDALTSELAKFSAHGSLGALVAEHDAFRRTVPLRICDLEGTGDL